MTIHASQVRVVHAPLSGPAPSSGRPEISRFSASWTSTLVDLRREASYLEAREVVICAEVPSSALRLDGGLRADARPSSPGVEVFLPETRQGAVRFRSGRYKGSGSHGYLPGWQANVRAVALGMEALRAVNRYGIAEDGEQYRGWQALPPGTPMPAAKLTYEQALRIMWPTGPAPTKSGAVPDDLVRARWRLLSRQHHPDAGGDPAAFRRLTEARDLLLETF